MWFDISTAGTAKTKASVNAKVVAIQLRQAGGLLFFPHFRQFHVGWAVLEYVM